MECNAECYVDTSAGFLPPAHFLCSEQPGHDGPHYSRSTAVFGPGSAVRWDDPMDVDISVREWG